MPLSKIQFGQLRLETNTAFADTGTGNIGFQAPTDPGLQVSATGLELVAGNHISISAAGVKRILPKIVLSTTDTSQNLGSATPTAINWTTVDYTDGAAHYTFTAPGTGVTIVQSGFYRVHFNLVADVTANTRTNWRARVYLNTATRQIAESVAYHRNTTQLSSTNSHFTIIFFTAGGVVSLQGLASEAVGAPVNLISGASQFVIERIGLS